MFKPPSHINKVLNEQYEVIDKANTKVVEVWKDDMVFSFGWWVTTFLVIVPWILWIIYRKKDSTQRLLLGGIWAMFIATWLNYIGVTMGLWRYNVKTIPVIPDFIAWDFSLIPVTIMFIIQIKPNIKPLYKAIFFSVLTSFGAEPFFKWLGFFDYPSWHYIASVPFYIAIFLVASKLVNGNNFKSLHS